jgi:hypothetical protein
MIAAEVDSEWGVLMRVPIHTMILSNSLFIVALLATFQTLLLRRIPLVSASTYGKWRNHHGANLCHAISQSISEILTELWTHLGPHTYGKPYAAHGLFWVFHYKAIPAHGG